MMYGSKKDSKSMSGYKTTTVKASKPSKQSSSMGMTQTKMPVRGMRTAKNKAKK
jgi:hypothetical protein